MRVGLAGLVVDPVADIARLEKEIPGTVNDDASEADLCLEDPGHDVDVSLGSTLRTMTQIWMGDVSLDQVRTKELLRVSGKRSLVRSLGNWLGPSPFAHVAPAMSEVLQEADSPAAERSPDHARAPQRVPLR
jgi:hypothetical protein